MICKFRKINFCFVNLSKQDFQNENITQEIKSTYKRGNNVVLICKWQKTHISSHHNVSVERLKVQQDPELGSRQRCRDNLTMFSGQNMLLVALCLFPLQLLYFLSLKLYYVVTLWLSRSFKIVACPALQPYLQNGSSHMKVWNTVNGIPRKFNMKFPAAPCPPCRHC